MSLLPFPKFACASSYQYYIMSQAQEILKLVCPRKMTPVKPWIDSNLLCAIRQKNWAIKQFFASCRAQNKIVCFFFFQFWRFSIPRQAAAEFFPCSFLSFSNFFNYFDSLSVLSSACRVYTAKANAFLNLNKQLLPHITKCTKYAKRHYKLYHASLADEAWKNNDSRTFYFHQKRLKPFTRRPPPPLRF